MSFNHYQLARIHELAKNCKDPDLLQLLNEWRAINNVLISRVFNDDSLNSEMEAHPDCPKSAYAADSVKYGKFTDSELERKSDILLRIINNRIRKRPDLNCSTLSLKN